MTKKFYIAAAVFALLTVTAPARAATIDYIFTGTGTGTLGGTPFSGDFNVTYVGDTATAVVGCLPASCPQASQNFTPVGTFTTLSLNTVFSSGTNVIMNTQFPAVLAFAQTSATGAIGVFSEAFVGYDLSTIGNFPLTSSSLPVYTNLPGGPQTFLTGDGNLTFDSVSALSFEATEPSAVPLPAALPLFGSAVLGLAGFGARKSRRTKTRG